jgi:hypothetical protein
VTHPKTKKFNDRIYRFSRTYRLKSEARKAAEAHRARGGQARVVADATAKGNKFAVYKRGGK